MFFAEAEKVLIDNATVLQGDGETYTYDEGKVDDPTALKIHDAIRYMKNMDELWRIDQILAGEYVA
jgi:hypothetical protein